MVEVKATDAITSVILDDELRPWNESQGGQVFGKYFPNRDEAKEYCNLMLEQHPNVVFWIYEENREPERIVKEVTTDNSAEGNKATHWGFWATIGLSSLAASTDFIMGFLGGFVFLTLAMSKNPQLDVDAYAASLESNGFYIAIIGIIAATIGAALILWFTKLRKNIQIKAYLGLVKPTSRQLVTWISILGVLLIWPVLVYIFFRKADPTMVSLLKTAYFPPALYIFVLLTAPVFEEVLYRGFLFKGILYSRLGPTGAVLLTTIMWTSIHFEYGAKQLIYIFFLGLLLGMARYKTNSIFLTMVMHSLWNFVVVAQSVLFLGRPGIGGFAWLLVTALVPLIAAGIGYMILAPSKSVYPSKSTVTIDRPELLPDGPTEGKQKMRRPVWVWIIAIFYCISIPLTLLGFYLILSGSSTMPTAQQAYFNSLTAFDYSITIIIAIANLFGAITLFLLRRTALLYLTCALVLNVILHIWHVLSKGYPTAAGVSVVSMVLSLAIAFAVCIYTWKLCEKDVLT